jgi:hypothetical protein
VEVTFRTQRLSEQEKLEFAELASPYSDDLSHDLEGLIQFLVRKPLNMSEPSYGIFEDQRLLKVRNCVIMG